MKEHVYAKLTNMQVEDLNECGEMADKGEDKDCTSCSCSVCIADQISVLKEDVLIVELTKIIQRLEREGVDLAVDDIKTVWKAKIYLGYSTPVSTEEGTGTMVK